MPTMRTIIKETLELQSQRRKLLKSLKRMETLSMLFATECETKTTHLKRRGVKNPQFKKRPHC